MCKCTPEIRTPWCGKPGCEMPPQTPRQDRSRERWRINIYDTFTDLFLCSLPLPPGRPSFVPADADDVPGEFDVPKRVFDALGIRFPGGDENNREVDFTVDRDFD